MALLLVGILHSTAVIGSHKHRLSVPNDDDDDEFVTQGVVA